MVRSEGMAFSPWNVLASGKIRTDAEEQARRKTGEHGTKFPCLPDSIFVLMDILSLGRVVQSAAWERTETERVVCKVLEEIGKEVGAKSIQAGMTCNMRNETGFLTIFSLPKKLRLHT